jgi:hypothetical protein
MQYVEKKFMEIDYNMLVQNHVHYNMLSKTFHLMGCLQWLKTWFLNVEVRNSSPHIYNLGYVGYLGDLIR